MVFDFLVMYSLCYMVLIIKYIYYTSCDIFYLLYIYYCRVCDIIFDTRRFVVILFICLINILYCLIYFLYLNINNVSRETFYISTLKDLLSPLYINAVFDSYYIVFLSCVFIVFYQYGG